MIFQGHRFKGQGPRNVFRCKQSDRRFAVDFYLVDYTEYVKGRVE